MSHKLNSSEALSFILGGKATITIKSLTTQTRRTFKIVKSKNNTVWFVRFMNGACNETNYGYLGYIRYVNNTYIYFHGGSKAKAKIDSTANIAFQFSFNLLKENKSHKSIEFWHEGSCCRCGRKLTVPESIESGWGPECVKFKNRL